MGDNSMETELIESIANFFDVPITLISPMNKEERKAFDKQWENIEKGAIEVTKKNIQNLKNKKRLEEITNFMQRKN